MREPPIPPKLPALNEAATEVEEFCWMGMGAALAAAMDSVSRLDTAFSFCRRCHCRGISKENIVTVT